jgi:prepilin-type N-terminal cleavage/methylation domain-containing protein
VRRENGFTLIEVLIVLAIVATLMGAVMVIIPYVQNRSKVMQTQSLLAEIEAALKQVEDPYQLAEFPPTDTTALRLKRKKIGTEIGQPNETNVGIETVTLVLFMKDLDIGRIDSKHLGNTDNDEAPKNFTIHKKLALFELCDAWGQPLVYIHSRDYQRVKEAPVPYVFRSEEEGGFAAQVVPFTDETTGNFYRPDTYQLFSVGPDGLPGNEDDIATFR